MSQKGFMFKEIIIEARTPHDAVCTLCTLWVHLCTIAEVVSDTNSEHQMTFS